MFLGFVASMLFGHAPIIFPAVLHLPIRFERTFYAYLALLSPVDDRARERRPRWLVYAAPLERFVNALALLLFLGNTQCTASKVQGRQSVKPSPASG